MRKEERRGEERREEEGAGNAYIQSFVKTGHTRLCISTQSKVLYESKVLAQILAKNFGNWKTIEARPYGNGHFFKVTITFLFFKSN